MWAYPPTRRQLAATIGVFAAGAALIARLCQVSPPEAPRRLTLLTRRPRPRPRPPPPTSDDFYLPVIQCKRTEKDC
ncbi:hypothetical protein NL676_001933 [Syzygium grande]|nr:hypothetical protein NL676_001933 [Syzygium grande]